ncbi:hypothetical protein CEXT_627471 [Caerostris extrusa]|uniref:Uncharacterized protein n=1 Tax=Caerostris extrusa TaxID=172846 RepID=A0AAV4MGW2_CAEEX|nr:hypothetical protein CEXT_627471 [Caerostris extrusa]
MRIIPFLSSMSGQPVRWLCRRLVRQNDTHSAVDDPILFAASPHTQSRYARCHPPPFTFYLHLSAINIIEACLFRL